MYSHRISILVPIYKVETYLSRCIESVLCQDFMDYELILVDDGSPDRCPLICDEYAARYDFVKVIHKENGGLISARKAGVLAASGEYYMFLDSDDWLQEGALSMLYAAIRSNGGYDYVRGGAQRVDAVENISLLERYEIEEGELVGAESFLSAIYTARIAPYLWGGLYRASLFSAETFDDSIALGISYGEDTVTNLVAGQKINKALLVRDVVYNYFVNPSSMVSTMVMSRQYIQRVEGFLKDRVFANYPKLLEWQQVHQAVYCFSYCFKPEFGFSVDYDHYAEQIKDPVFYQKVKSRIDHRYLLFVRHKVLYQVYSWVFRLVYGLKRKNRSVVLY